VKPWKSVVIMGIITAILGIAVIQPLCVGGGRSTYTTSSPEYGVSTYYMVSDPICYSTWPNYVSNGYQATLILVFFEILGIAILVVGFLMRSQPN
jgi:uncharacterized membrane protein HdeD (DUF308 family)